ncbi:MAG: hypothetical protein ACQESS_03190 [Bacillota bacterium]
MLFKSILSGFIFYVLNLIYYLIKKIELKTVFFESLNRTVIFVLILNLLYLLIKVLKNSSQDSGGDGEKKSNKETESHDTKTDRENSEDDGFSPINPPEIEYTQRED